MKVVYAKKGKKPVFFAAASLVVAMSAAQAANQPSLQPKTSPNASFSSSNFLTKWHSKNPEFTLQLGGFFAHQGSQQLVGIQGLVGNNYTVTKSNSNNGLVGLGYYLDGWSHDRFDLSYGLNTFYFGPASVHGDVVQQNVYANLSYKYDVYNFPLYFAAKGKIKDNTGRYMVTVDAGIGPNFMRTANYKEAAINPIATLDNAFYGKSSVEFAAMAGLGLRVGNVFGKAPLECGYRFFYFGEGELQQRTERLLSPLKTGQTYAQAIVCGLII